MNKKLQAILSQSIKDAKMVLDCNPHSLDDIKHITVTVSIDSPYGLDDTQRIVVTELYIPDGKGGFEYDNQDAKLIIYAGCSHEELFIDDANV
jgi:hypothetical protein